MRKMWVIAVALGLGGVAGSENSAADLFQAIRNNDLTYLKTQLGKGADINTRDARGATLLMHATAFGSLEAMKLLLDSGADVNARSALDATALIWGAGDPQRARTLIDKGAGVNAKSKLGRTPLMIAADCDGCSETVRLLLEKGADPNARDGRGTSALRLAADANDFESMRMLIDKGAPADAPDGDGETPLLSAASSCNVPAVRFLLAKGANVNAANTFSGEVKFGKILLIGLTPLMLAAPYCSAEMTRTLLDAGAKVNVKDIREMTALMLAVASDRQDAVTVGLLLKAGADVNAKSKAGETALDWARKFGNREAVAALTATGARPGDPFSPPQRPPATPRSMTEAVASGTALLQRSSTEFFKQSGCVGCHHQPMTIVAVAAARAGGARVDEGAAQGHIKMLEGQWTGFQEMVLQHLDLGGGTDQEVISLAALAAARYPANTITDSMAGMIAGVQRRDGTWQLLGAARPPMEDGAIGRTALAMHLLQVYGPPARRAEFEKRIARARDWLLAAKPLTNDDSAMQLAGLYWAGVDPGKVRSAGRFLIGRQRADGGWSSNRNLASDAFATGESLWALKESGVLNPSDPVYQKGVKYLLSTQWQDGSWYVRSRAPKFQPYFQSGFPFEHDQWISSTATAWAVMALAPAMETEKRASR
ncbi:MAG: ankyrin repeat domain-containing protein [Acidobacteriia bacterium]|nr:ankyrin repeat domain-containing protein [Terriglobia bacterium]